VVVGKLVDRLIEAACAVTVVALTVIVCLQVFNRFVLKTPLAWSEDLAMLLFQWVVFLGAALGVKRVRHFGIELVVRRFPERWRHRVELLTPAVMAIVALVMIVQGWTLLTFNRNRTFPTMDLTYTWAFLPIPLAGALILIYLVQLEIRRWRGDPPAEGGHGR
jgi:TRAP-type transport system small permease protein